MSLDKRSIFSGNINAKTRRIGKLFWEWILGVCLYFWDFLQLGPEMVNLFNEVAKGSLKGTVLNLSTTLMGIICAVKIGTLYFKEEAINDVVNKFRDFDKKVRERLPLERVEELSKKREFYCKLSVVGTPITSIMVVHWVLRPLVLVFYGEKVLIIESWVPGDINNNLLWAFFFINQTVHVYTAMYGFNVFDSLVFSMIVSLWLCIDYLKTALSSLDFSNGSVDKGKATLRFCIELNRDIIWLAKSINKILVLGILIQIVSATIVLCLAVFELSSIDGTTTMKVMNLIEMIALTGYSTFFCCFLCQQIQDQNVLVMRAAYNNNWYEGNLKDKRALCNVIESWKKEFRFGIILEANLQTAITILKSSFTYFNFLKAISGEDSISL